MKNVILLTIFLASIFLSFKTFNIKTALDIELEKVLEEIAPEKGKAYYQLPSSDDFLAIPQDPQNPITKEKVALGKLLFHETGFSVATRQKEGKGTFSCASCHFADAGFQSNNAQGLGEGGLGITQKGQKRSRNPAYLYTNLDAQAVKTTSILNSAYQEITLYNGQFGAVGDNIGTEDKWQKGSPKALNNLGYHGLETQAIAGLTIHRMSINAELVASNKYTTLFDTAFPNTPKAERYTKITAGLAIAAYERTVLANQAPFQYWLKGNYEAMNKIEKEGALLFFGKAKCYECHNNPALNSMAFYALGLNNLSDEKEEVFKVSAFSLEHYGRGGFTRKDTEDYQFKVPQLYNLADSPFYGHGSSFTSIKGIVAYKNQGIPENPRVPEQSISPKFQPLGLNNGEVIALTAFLSKSLKDPNLKRYEPTTLPSGNNFPNADSLSIKLMTALSLN